MWGTHLSVSVLLQMCWFIPTCVGNSFPHAFSPSCASVHPHVCGELVSGEIVGSAGAGSSPRVWGTPRCTEISCNGVRFIPTCVGNSHRSNRYPPRVPVHPHVCGELSSRNLTIIKTSGSSPRVWGTHHTFPVMLRFDRFIPTCVGNSTIERN